MPNIYSESNKVDPNDYMNNYYNFYWKRMEKIQKYAKLTTKEKIRKRVVTSSEINDNDILDESDKQSQPDIERGIPNLAIHEKFKKYGK